jgi:uncharacterized membrane protein HdeD (DUF308 family)
VTQLGMAGAVALARWWWALIVRGLVAIAFGVICFAVPDIAVLTLVALFGLWALIEGMTSVLTGLRRRAGTRSWWVDVLEGILSIAAGVIALLFSSFTVDILRYVIAAWAIVIGVLQIYLAIRLRAEIRGEVWLGLAGVVAIAFGISMLLFPVASVLSLVWLIGSFAIAFGVFLALLGWRLRRINDLAKRDAATDFSRP